MIYGMTPREQLRDQVDRMSDDEAAHVLDLIGADEAECAERQPLTPEQIASVERGLADSRAGRTYTTDEVRERLQAVRSRAGRGRAGAVER